MRWLWILVYQITGRMGIFILCKFGYPFRRGLYVFIKINILGLKIKKIYSAVVNFEFPYRYLKKLLLFFHHHVK